MRRLESAWGHSCSTIHLGYLAYTKDGTAVKCLVNPSGTPAQLWQVVVSAADPVPVFPLKVQQGHACSANHFEWVAYTKDGMQLTCRTTPLGGTPARSWQP